MTDGRSAASAARFVPGHGMLLGAAACNASGAHTRSVGSIPGPSCTLVMHTNPATITLPGWCAARAYEATRETALWGDDVEAGAATQPRGDIT